jgi:ketosteroid isomerase-like protein
VRAKTLLACLALAAAPAFADPAADAKAHSEAFARAMAARDVAAAVALYADDARVIWPGQGEEAQGKAEITKLLDASLKAAPDSSPVLVSQDVVSLGDGLIASLGQWKQDMKGPDGKVETVRIRTSEIIKKVGGKTLYVVDHASIGVPPAPAGAGAPPAAP